MEEDQNSEYAEVTPQDHVSEYAASLQDLSEDAQQGQAEDVQEKNWKELRRKSELAEQRAREYEERAKYQDELIKNLLQSQQQQKTHIPQAEEVDEFAAIPDDEFLSKGQSRKLLQKDARQIAREEFLALERERQRLQYKERLKTRYSDYEQVVNDQTIKKFEQEQPELASSIAKLGDPYDMGLQAYNYMKLMGYGAPVEEDRHAREVREKIDKNENKVQTPQAYNKRPMAQAFSMNRMSKEEKAKLYNEMVQYASQTSGY